MSVASQWNEAPASIVPVAQRRFPALLVLFACSGCAALIYEIVWFQSLELVIGSSAISLGILLGTFMGGMCLGSLLLPPLVSPRLHPLRVYAAVELGIGLVALLLLFAMPLVGGMYTAWAGPSAFGMVLRGIVAGVCLLPPTFLMGASFPLISRWVEAMPQGASWIGLLYGGNICGAVMGSLLTGFYLLRFYDVATATYVAVGLNAAVALLSMLLAGAIPYLPATAPEQESANQPTRGASAVYVVTALSGMTALAAEVIWTRLLSLVFGATVYAFALILAVFLLGLGIGASLGSALSRKTARPGQALGWCQLFLCAAIAWTAYQLVHTLPYWPVSAATAANPWLRMLLDFRRCASAALPPAILWGASFPLALASVASRNQDSGRWVGRLYGANTIGGIVGSLSASLLLMAWIGSRHTQQALIAISALSGLLALASFSGAKLFPSKAALSAAVALAVLAAGLLIWSVPQVPGYLIAFGRNTAVYGPVDILYSAEGLTASVAVSRGQHGVLNYHSAGKIQASTEPQDMRLQRMLAHLTTLVPANPRSFLVIGLGAGVTAGAVSIEPHLERETIVDIEPLVPKAIASYFRDYNFDVLAQPNVHLLIDDGRHFLLTTKETFDGITADPFDPWVKGIAALYSKEFFELARRHLNPGGVITQFVPLYDSNEEAVKSEIATFFEVFPNGKLFANTIDRQGYDMVLLGQVERGPMDADRVEQRTQSPEYARVARSLEEIGFASGADLLATYVAQASDLQPWLKGAAINRDRNLRVQYLAGMSLDAHHEDEIYAHMIAFGPHLSPNVFSGSEALLEYLDQAIKYGTSR
jgi:spermidine synthase